MELLAPAGNLEKLKTALHFGADAVYFSGKKFGLRAFAGNFTDEEIEEAFEYLHSHGKKGYVTINIVANDEDFNGIDDYLKLLVKVKADGVIVGSAIVKLCGQYKDACVPYVEEYVKAMKEAVKKASQARES